MSTSAKNYISCSLFEKLSSSEKGTILSIDQGDAKITNCRFNNVKSSSSPGCFYITKSSFELKKCTFSLCFANGANNNFGKIAYTLESKVNVNHFSAVRCSPSASSNGDSLNAFHSSTVLIRDYNSSYCYGVDGSSAVSICKTTTESIVKFLNGIDGIDWSIYEIFNNDVKTYTEFSNFINSSKNSHYCIDTNYANEDCEFTNCSFFDSCSVFCSNPSKMKIINCISDKEQSSFAFITITKQSLEVLIKAPILCYQQTKVSCNKLSYRITKIFIITMVYSI